MSPAKYQTKTTFSDCDFNSFFYDFPPLYLKKKMKQEKKINSELISWFHQTLDQSENCFLFQLLKLRTIHGNIFLRIIVCCCNKARWCQPLLCSQDINQWIDLKNSWDNKNIFRLPTDSSSLKNLRYTWPELSIRYQIV